MVCIYNMGRLRYPNVHVIVFLRTAVDMEDTQEEKEAEASGGTKRGGLEQSDSFKLESGDSGMPSVV